MNCGSIYFSRSSTGIIEKGKQTNVAQEVYGIYNCISKNLSLLTFLVKNLDSFSLVCCVCKGRIDPHQRFNTLKQGKDVITANNQNHDPSCTYSGLLRCFPSGRLCYGASRLSLTVHQTPKHAWWAFHYISFLLLHTPHSVTLCHEIYIIFNQSTYTIHCTCLYCCSRLLVTL